MKIYWVTTSDHCEDWFVIAAGKNKAKSFFANYEGYNYRDVSALELFPVSKEYQTKGAYHPSTKVLKKLGFKIDTGGQTHIAWKNGKVYQLGNTTKNLALQIYNKVPVVYIIKQYDHNLYKIGVTKDINRRLKTFNTASPQGFDIYDIVYCENPNALEKMLHSTFEKKRYTGEWFLLNETDKQQLSSITKNFSKVKELF